MGQKINPTAYRIGVTKPWPARWFFPGKRQAGSSGLRSYRTFLQEDEAIRTIVRGKVGQAGIAALEIDRTAGSLKILIRAARPGLVIGRGGKGIEDLTKALDAALRRLRGGPVKGLSVNVEELKRTEVAAAYVAQQIAWDLERRMPFRQLLRRQLDQVMQNRGVQGAKIRLAGRLDGAEIARDESKMKGSLPLQTFRADIDYATATAYTTYGTIGVKVWIYKGEVV